MRETAFSQSSADQSSVIPGLLLQRKCACGQHTIGGGECSACKQTLQRKSGGNSAGASVPASVSEILHSPGQPLGGSVRSSMESRFGEHLDSAPVSSAATYVASSSTIAPSHDQFEREADSTAEAVSQSSVFGASMRSAGLAQADFSHVRIHSDDRAARSADEIGALAFTAGNHIVFGRGQFAPQTSRGRQLLAHELTHVLQQRGGSRGIQRKVKEKTPCQVHAYDNSIPKDPAIVPTDGSGIGVSSVADLVTKANAFVDDEKNSCSCINRLDINGHGTDGYQSVGNGSSYINNDKALVHDSTDEHLQQLSKIKFCSTGLFMMIGCHVGRGNGKTLLHRLSAILPGKLIGGAQHFTGPTAKGGPLVQGEGDVLTSSGNLDTSKADPFLTSRFVRWYITIDGKEYVINGDETTSKEGKAKLKAADKIKVKTPDSTVRIK
jgi:Domain of unknown function (DUF4157)